MSILFFPPLAIFLIASLFVMGMGKTTLTVDAAPKASVEEKKGEDGESKGTASPRVLAPLFTPEVLRWKERILAWAKEWDVDPNLVATVMQIESCGDPTATSGAGAMGLFQVMPYHFASGEYSYDPDTNAYRGMAYLRRALDTYGDDARLAFAGYNGGITTAGGPESGWPDETLRYVYWGEGIYQDAVRGASSSQRLNEWLGRGGASLCAQAARQPVRSR